MTQTLPDSHDGLGSIGQHETSRTVPHPPPSIDAAKMASRPQRVFDLGMHMGEDTALYLALGFDVVAFEANPDLVAHAQRRFSSELSAGRLTIVQGAVADGAKETITFYKNKWKPVWGTTSSDWASRNSRMLRDSEAIEVACIDFAQVLRTHGMPWFMKMDIEGAEDLVMNEIERHPDRPAYLSIESDKVDFTALVEMADRLRRLGYTRFKAVQQATIPGRTQTLKTSEGKAVTYTFEPHASGPFGDDAEGQWLSFAQLLSAYHRIFEAYERVGDETIFGSWGRPVTKAFEKVFKVCLPGWHDLHAAL